MRETKNGAGVIPIRPIGGLILAAGQSRRMGGHPKALLKTGRTEDGPSFAISLIDAFRKAELAPIVVVVGHEAARVRAHVVNNRPETTVITNEHYRNGMLSSIQQGLGAIRGHGCRATVVCPVDHPSVSPETILAIVEAFDSNKAPIVIPAYNGQRGHPVLFAEQVFEELDRAPTNIGARQVVWDHAEDLQELRVLEPDVLADIDTPELYRAFRESGAQGVAQEVTCLEQKQKHESNEDSPKR